MMMLILISGPYQIGIDMNVYLRPLEDDLKYSSQMVVMQTTGTRGNSSHYLVCCSARLLTTGWLFRVQTL